MTKSNRQGFSNKLSVSSSFSIARRTLGIDKFLSTFKSLGDSNEKISQKKKINRSTQQPSVNNVTTSNPSGVQQSVINVAEGEHSGSSDIVERNNTSLEAELKSVNTMDMPNTDTQSHSERDHSENITTHESPTPPKRQNWSNSSFCYDFLENTFRQSLTVCSNEPANNHSIKCYGSSHSEHMATCTIENLAVQLPILAKAMYHPDSVSFQYDDSLTLINDHPQTCTRPTTSNLRGRVENGDYVLKLVQKVSDANQVESKVCEKWINETVYFYTANPHHIYFHILDMYNLHKLVSTNHEKPGQFKILRVSTSDDYHFEEFDKLVFPESLHISELPSVRTCFRKVILVPKSYASVLFQCKMHWQLRKDCMDCDGTGLVNTSFSTFRNRVIKACSLDDQVPRKNSSLVLISRTPYLRDPDDKPEKFERLLSNEDELISSLRNKYPAANVSAVHFENFSVCEQIRLANEANVFLGVHGAGLVHLWWLREDALAFEMEPYFEVGNPTFKVLSKITGRRYYNDYIGGGWQKVNAEINSVLKALDRHATVP